jgi:hypothetical protein
MKVFLDERDIENARTIPCYPDLVLPPPIMMVGDPDESGFAEWRAVDSPIDDDLLARFERFLDCKLPPLFKEYLKYKCIYNVDFDFAILPMFRFDEPLGWLQWAWDRMDRVKPGVIPFVSGPFTASILCFDVNHAMEDGDCPVLKVHSEDEVPYRVFDSFHDYFAFVKNVILYRDQYRPRKFEEWLKVDQSTFLELEDWLRANNLKPPYPEYFNYFND